MLMHNCKRIYMQTCACSRSIALEHNSVAIALDDVLSDMLIMHVHVLSRPSAYIIRVCPTNWPCWPCWPCWPTPPVCGGNAPVEPGACVHTPCCCPCWQLAQPENCDRSTRPSCCSSEARSQYTHAFSMRPLESSWSCMRIRAHACVHVCTCGAYKHKNAYASASSHHDVMRLGKTYTYTRIRIAWIVVMTGTTNLNKVIHLDLAVRRGSAEPQRALVRARPRRAHEQLAARGVDRRVLRRHGEVREAQADVLVHLEDLVDPRQLVAVKSAVVHHRVLGEETAAHHKRVRHVGVSLRCQPHNLRHQR